ncbi:hypothetical protein DPMN_158524 [Dreissena polymorpha]|uniref:Uncharacterized protein n=1 Tax=Dreissena polymorpha TaxID=45954 RepID=A0A9D4EJZ6_DREPO|nr:hypothetical protein DPMN_158524 [Dreissena polymorpha]
MASLGFSCGYPASAVVGTLASHLGNRVPFPFTAWCGFGWWSPYRTGGVSSRYFGFPPQHKIATNSSYNSKFVQTLERLARLLGRSAGAHSGSPHYVASGSERTS